MDDFIKFGDVNIHHNKLSGEARVGMALAKDKVEQYIAKGRIKEAQGATKVLCILYQALIGIRDIDTGWGEL